jgi:ABC-type antimicrobial peptide transport system permease subunit
MSETGPAEGTVAGGTSGAVVTAEGVTRRYGEGDTAVDALKGVSIEVEYMSLTAVMGPSGSGKSTLMHILAGLDRPSSGEVTIAGTSITGLDDTALTKLRRDHIGFVFQFFNLLPMLTAEENVVLPLDIAGAKPDRDWVDHVITTLGLSERRTHRPSEGVTTRSNGINKLLNLLYVLLALSVFVSLFGMINTLVLAIFERTRELGMLRAVGMTRRQVRGMIRQESVITALIGAALGLPIGIFLAALVTRALSDQGLSFSLPVLWLAAFTLVAVLAGILAAVFPARRAARLNVLEALQYE